MDFFNHKNQQKNIRIYELFRQGFDYWKHYSFRMEYTNIEYEQNIIPMSFRTFCRTIFIELNAWSAIIYMFSMITWPDNEIFIEIEDIEHMMNVKHITILAIEMISAFFILELMWFQLFHDIIQYRSSFNEFFANNWNYDDRQHFRSKKRLYLIKFYLNSNSMAIIIYWIVMTSVFFLLIIHIFYLFVFYVDGRINLLEMFICIPLTAMIVSHLNIITNHQLLSCNFLVFLMEFFKIRFEQLLFISNAITNQSEQKRKIFWKHFQNEYVELYREISRLNCTIRRILFDMEMISKSSIITTCIFYSRQTNLNVFNMTAIGAMLSRFILTTMLYSRVSRLPAYNQHCCRSIMKGLCRLQWSTSNQLSSSDRTLRLWPKIIKNRTSHDLIRKNLFLQTMSSNQFGFHCGQMFFITKFKYIQLLILNFHLVIKFYKKICLTSTSN